MKTIIKYGLILGIFVFLLDAMEYFYWVHNHSFEIYGFIIALLFLLLGLWFGENRNFKKIKSQFSENIKYSKNDLGISKREYEVLVLLLKGLSNQAIADHLFVSTNTIKTHTSRLFEKLNVKNRLQAIIRAKEIGLVD